MDEKMDSRLMLGLVPILFFAFSIFIPIHVIEHFANFQKIFLIGLLLFYWVWLFFKKEKVILVLIDLALLAFIFIQVVSGFFSEYPATIWTSINHWVMFLFMILLLRRIPYDNTSNKWYWAIHLSSLVSVSQVVFTFLKIFLEGKSGFNFSEYQAIGNYTIGNTNFLASAIALHIPFILSLKRSEPFQSIFSYFLVFCSLVLIFLLNSRGVSLSVVLMFIFWGIKEFKHFTALKIFVIPLILVGSVIIVVTQIGDRDAFLKTYNPVSSFQQTDKDDRIELWNRSVQLFKEKPLLGHGLASWRIHYLQYGTGNLRTSSDELFYVGHAHNFYFELLAETGIIGLLLFLFIVIFPLIISFRQQDGLSFYVLLLISCFLLFYGIFYQGSVKHSPHIFAWAFALSQLKFNQKFVLNRLFQFLGFVVLSLSMFYSLWDFYATIEISRLKSISKSEAFAQAEKLEKLYHPLFMNYSGRYCFKEYIATANWLAGEREESIAWLELARKDNPYRAKILFDLGLRNKAMKNYKKSQEYFQKALDINETVDRVKIELMKMSVKTKDWKTFDYYINGIEENTRSMLGYYYNDEILESDNVLANRYLKKQCYVLDEILKLKEIESKRRSNN